MATLAVVLRFATIVQLFNLTFCVLIQHTLLPHHHYSPEENGLLHALARLRPCTCKHGCVNCC